MKNIDQPIISTSRTLPSEEKRYYKKKKLTLPPARKTVYKNNDSLDSL